MKRISPNWLNKLGLFAALILMMASCKSSIKLFSAGQAPDALYFAEVPMEDFSNLQIIPVEINGKSYRFLFDTGAPMVISTELQAELSCKILVKRKVTDSQGETQKQNYVQLPDVAIGEKHFANLTAVVVDLRQSDVIACLNLDGIVGANLMRHAMWKLDYKNQKMYFTNDSTKMKVPSTAIAMPFRNKATFTPVVDLKIDSVELKSVTFDTGSGSGLSLGSVKLKKSHLDAAKIRNSYGYHSSGIYGTAADTACLSQNVVELGEGNFGNITVSLYSSSAKALLGGDFMKNYNVFLDWNKQMVYLDSTRAPKQSQSIGFSLFIQNEELYVGSMLQDSPAEKMGIDFNDKIISINGQDCRKVSSEMYCEYLALWKDKDQPVQVEIENKGTFTLAWSPLF